MIGARYLNRTIIWALLGLSFLLNTGCSPVTQTRKVYDDSPNWHSTTNTIPKDHSVAYLTSSIESVDRVKLAIFRQPMGELVISNSGPRKVVIERTTGQRAWGWAGLGVGLALGGLGGWTFAEAHKFEPGPEGGRGAIYFTGCALVGTGLAMLISGINELVRSRNTTEFKGIVTDVVSRTDIKIGAPLPWENQTFSVFIDKTKVGQIRTDNEGDVTIDASFFPLDIMVANEGTLAKATVLFDNTVVGGFNLDWAMLWHEQTAWAALHPSFEFEALAAFVKQFPSSVHRQEARARLNCSKVTKIMDSLEQSPDHVIPSKNSTEALNEMRKIIQAPAPNWAMNSVKWEQLRLSCTKYWTETESTIVSKGVALLEKQEVSNFAVWKREIINEAHKYMKQGEFSEAFDVLAEAINSHPEDKQLESAKRKVERAQSAAEAHEKAIAERKEHQAKAHEAGHYAAGYRNYLIQDHWGWIGNVVSYRQITVQGSSDFERDNLACKQFCNLADDKFTCILHCQAACQYGSIKLHNPEIYTCEHN